MKRLIMIGVLMLTACTKADFYELGAVTEARIATQNGQRVLEYQVRLDSLYHSPGLTLSQRNGQAVFKVARCKVGTQCPVDFPSELVRNRHRVVLPKNISGAVRIEGRDGAQLEPAPEKVAE